MNEMNNLIFLLIGAVLGFFISRLFSKPSTGAQSIQKNLEQSQAEFEAYRQQVSDHFTSSAELLEDLAKNYQDVYEHMARQSKTLLSEETEQPSLFANFEEPKEASTEPHGIPPKDYSSEPSGLLNESTKVAT